MENLSIVDKVLNDKKDVNDFNYSFKNILPLNLRKIFLNESVTEVMINDTESIFIEERGLIRKLDFVLKKSDIQKIVDYLSQKNSRNIDYNHPIFDGKITGGIRCNVLIEPVSTKGVVLTFRKHMKGISDLDVLIKKKMFSKSVKEIMLEALKNKKNILISGGTGSGKTTLLNALLNNLDKNERIITIEDTVELNLNSDHLISLEARIKTPDCPLVVTIRDLVKASLRMRPDRLIVGEVRGEEAYDFLHAMNTGHKGTFSTIHANSARDALRRLETLSILNHPNLNISIPRNWISSNINVIIHLEKVDGVRTLTELKEIEGFEFENYVLRDLLNN
jgi:pilus assembly protein CpaF